MIQHFINRKNELEFLERKYKSGRAELVVLYGRRRVGKTELIKKFIERKRGIYFLCTRDSIKENIRSLKEKFYELTKKELFLKLEVNSFFELFKILVEEVKKERIVIAIDEFPYLIELEKGIVSVFQKIWDELLKNTKIMLILCGSSIGMMESDVLSYKSPLYGRRTAEWKISPFRFKDIHSMLKFSVEDLVKVWCVFGNIPFYLAQIDGNLSIEENIKRKIFTKGEILYNEPRILLREEFREPRIYMLILKHLSLGYNSFGKLSSATGIEKGNLSKYLSVLEETHIVEHILPLGGRKRGIYHIIDPFFNFWFGFVYPNLSDLEVGLVEETFSKIKGHLNAYYGKMFEYLIMELIKTKFIDELREFALVRKWWHNDKEIDIVALDEKHKKALVAECKWKNRVNAERVVKELEEKVGYVKELGNYKIEYAVFAKGFSKRVREFNGKKVYCFGLRELKKILKRKK